jgi:hypothetical protein
MTSRATIQLPNITDPNFTNFKLFYRIYISDRGDVDEQITQDNSALQGTINPTLRSNVSGINTDPANTAINTTTVNNYIRNFRLYELELEDRNMDTFLRTSGSLLINFPLTGIPYAEKGSENYYLLRSTGESSLYGGVFRPATDDLYLRNTAELNRSEYATPNLNGDVADNASAGTPRYTYILIYIVCSGFDSANLGTIYSTRTFVGVFRLPELSIGS